MRSVQRRSRNVEKTGSLALQTSGSHLRGILAWRYRLSSVKQGGWAHPESTQETVILRDLNHYFVRKKERKQQYKIEISRLGFFIPWP